MKKNGQGHVTYVDVDIGAGVQILDPDTVDIQYGSVIEPNVVIYPNVTIGHNVRIAAGTVIGSRPFIYKIGSTDMPTIEKVYGEIVISHAVHIGANCVIDAARKRTTIGSGSKIDNLCHIAHDCILGNNVLLVAGTILGGHVTIGNDSRIGLNSTVRNRVTIGYNCFIGMDLSIDRDVPNLTRVTKYERKKLL